MFPFSLYIYIKYIYTYSHSFPRNLPLPSFNEQASLNRAAQSMGLKGIRVGRPSTALGSATKKTGGFNTWDHMVYNPIDNNNIDILFR